MAGMRNVAFNRNNWGSSKALLVCLCTASLLSCAHSLTLKTKPAGAKVYQIDANGNRGALLGQTPLDLSSIQKHDFLGLEIEKSGYIKQSLVVPLPSTSKIEINLSLAKFSDQFMREMMLDPYAPTLNRAVEDLIGLQTDMVYGVKDSEIETSIAKLKTTYDKLSIFHTMLGAYYYTKKNFTKAAASYQKALELDPNNGEAVRMLSIMKVKR